MTPRCALCGRLTLQPAVMVGNEPIGPKCAKRAGLLKPRTGSRVRLYVQPRVSRDEGGRTLDLFVEVPA